MKSLDKEYQDMIDSVDLHAETAKRYGHLFNDRKLNTNHKTSKSQLDKIYLTLGICVFFIFIGFYIFY